MKRPAFQFYPADWRKDVELQSCSMAAQGLWINMMCVAHECEPYGHLTVNGKAMTSAQLGRQVGLSVKETDALIGELIDAGVARRTPDGVLYSHRMVKDEDLRNRRANGGQAGAEHGMKGAEFGSKGGRPPKPRGDTKPPLVPPLEPPPSSSSSSSSSTSEDKDKGAGIREVDARAPENRSPGAEACIRMKAAGLQAVNPGHPKLLALLAAGITVDELANAAADAVAKGKNFAYAMATAEGRRRDAATPPLPDRAAVTVPSRSDRDPVLAQKDAEAAAWRPPTDEVKAMLAQTAARLKGVTT